MNDPQDTAIEQAEADPPESADSDLSDEALDRPHVGGEYSRPATGLFSAVHRRLLVYR